MVPPVGCHPPWRRSIMQPTHWSNPGTDLAKSSRECSRCWCSGIFFLQIGLAGEFEKKMTMGRCDDSTVWHDFLTFTCPLALILKSITCTWLWREFPDVSIVRSNFPYKCRQGYLQKHLHHINHIHQVSRATLDGSQAIKIRKSPKLTEMLHFKVPWAWQRFPKDSWQKQDAMLKRLTVEYELVGNWHRGPAFLWRLLFLSNNPSVEAGPTKMNCQLPKYNFSTEP